MISTRREPSYRVDLRDANVVKIWAFEQLGDALAKLREGLAEEYDDGFCYKFTAPGNAVLVAQFAYYRKVLNGTT